MYEKNLTEDLRLRLTSRDMEFLRDLSYSRGLSVSEVIRSIIGDYRRSYLALEAISRAVDSIDSEEDAGHGVTETAVNNKL